MAGNTGESQKLKVALVSPYDYATPGGVNDHVSNLASQLTSSGNSVKIIAPLANSGSTDHGPNFIPMGRPVPIPAAGSIARVSLSYWRERSIRAILMKENFDICHLHEPAMPWLSLSVLRYSKSTNIGTFHTSRGTRFYRLWGLYAKRYLERLHGRIAVSHPAMETVKKFFPGEYSIIPNGVDIERFSTPLAPIEKYNDSKLNIVFVSRLERRKGLKYLVKAYSKLKWKYPFLRLIIVGSGNPGEEVLGLISQHGLEDVELVGGVPYEELPRYYQAADIFCAPNTGRESFGIILAEAMASSKPIVASRIDGFSRVISNGVEGLLVKPRDEQELASGLEQLIQDPQLRVEMGGRGRESVEAYRWSKVAADIEAYYRYAISINSKRD